MRTNVRSLLFVLLLVPVGLWAANDPLIGTWKLNLAKSKYSPGYAVPKSQTYKYEASGADGVKFTNDTVEADGRSIHAEYTAQFDGNEVPITGDPTRDSTSQKRVDTYTTHQINKKAGKVVNTVTRVVSKDGKTLTISAKGMRDGKPYDNVMVYNNQ